MICPVCSTQHTDKIHAENAKLDFCVQCGADIKIHQLLHRLQEISFMHDEAKLQKQPLTSVWIDYLLTFFKIMLHGCVIIFLIFSIYFGEQILTLTNRYINHIASYNAQSSHQPLNTEIATLQHMNQLMERELNLIVELHTENTNLQNKLEAMQSATPKEDKSETKQ